MSIYELIFDEKFGSEGIKVTLIECKNRKLTFTLTEHLG